jgi:hypothetical protein
MNNNNNKKHVQAKAKYSIVYADKFNENVNKSAYMLKI